MLFPPPSVFGCPFAFRYKQRKSSPVESCGGVFFSHWCSTLFLFDRVRSLICILHECLSLSDYFDMFHKTFKKRFQARTSECPRSYFEILDIPEREDSPPPPRDTPKPSKTASSPTSKSPPPASQAFSLVFLEGFPHTKDSNTRFCPTL